VGVQVALSVVLLAGAGLLLRSSAALSRVDAGFDADHALTFHLSGNYAETNNFTQYVQRFDTTLEALRGLPQVEDAATSRLLPGMRNDFSSDFEFTDGGMAPTPVPLTAQMRVVAPSYFATFAIPLLAGATCRDATDRSPTADFMINRSFADRYLAGRPPVGIGLRSGGGFPVTGRIVGVVGDARETGMDRAPVPTVYPCQTASSPFAWFVVRTRGDPALAAGAVRTLLAELEPARAIYEMATIEQQIGGVYRANRLRTMLLTVFAAAALALACIGLYGTLSYVVSLRHREVGLRMALGARRESIVATFVAKALRVVGAATLVGAALFLAIGEGMRSMLYGVAPWDPLTVGAVVLIMIGLAALAAALPAVRASRVDPMTVLREE
jgi:putative ABC transport system permease protein